MQKAGQEAREENVNLELLIETKFWPIKGGAVARLIMVATGA